MSAPIVWFNKYLSNTWEVLEWLRRVRQPEEFRILCTHPRPGYPGQRHSDLFEVEPDGLAPAAYVDYCLDVVRRHGVTLFLPGRNLIPITRAHAKFTALGARVIAAAETETLKLLSHKARVCAALHREEVRLPDFEVVNDLAGFDAAWERLRPRHGSLCYKPAVSVYGIGFHIVTDSGPALRRLAAGDPTCISLARARASLGKKGRFPDLLLMQFLPGPERSVDCVARDGVLLRAIVRRKLKKSQVLEDNPKIVEVVRRLTARFGLTNLFNVQFRNQGGRSYLLEINPRMSGGLPFTCRSGLVLPYWAIRLALGTATPEETPQPRTGIRVPQPVPASSL